MTTRREFIAAGSFLTLAPDLAQAATPQPKSEPPELTFDFDQTRFNAILSKEAKHKQCFGIKTLAYGSALEGMANSIRAYDEFLKEGPGAIQLVGVLYHGPAIAFAMNDTIWDQYLAPLAKHAPPAISADMAEIQPGHGNPYKKQVADLVSKGASFFVCHNAIVGFSDFAAKALKTTAAGIHGAIMAGILPGALVVPAGVMAINAAQEAKFTYIAS